jgi:hypothetical protein
MGTVGGRPVLSAHPLSQITALARVSFPKKVVNNVCWLPHLIEDSWRTIQVFLTNKSRQINIAAS